MGTKVKKGILKPLRYISLMFDSKEPEMQIGGPTDVKHVAHIGWDGPNVGAPGWMKDYHSAPLDPTAFSGEAEKESPVKNLWGSQEFMRVDESPSIENSVDESRDNVQVPYRARHGRRHQSDGIATADSSNREPSDGSNRRNRRPRKKEVTNGTDMPAQDVPAIPKQSHRRRPKGAAEGGGESVKSSGGKALTTSAGANAAYQESVTKPQQKLDHTAEDGEDSE